MGTDAEWKRWGSKDPYYAVLSADEFHGGAERERFFEHGRRHFASLTQRFDELGLPLNRQGAALDYGCGVGRVLRPMGEYFQQTMGIDVSPAMLDEARRNTISGTELRLIDGGAIASCIGERHFEFIHSTLVFQHIPRKRGLLLLAEIGERIVRGGKAVIQLPIAAKHLVRHRVSRLLKASPSVCKLARLVMLRPHPFEPVMQMNIYPVERLLQIWSTQGLAVRYVDLKVDGDIWQGRWYLYKR